MSKNVDKVKEVIKAHLDAMAQKDACFSERYANHDKNIDECMDYILSEARKRGRTVYMSDQEVLAWRHTITRKTVLRFRNSLLL